MDEIELPENLTKQGIFFLNLIKDSDFGEIVKCGKFEDGFIRYFFYKLNQSKEIEEIKDEEEVKKIDNLYGTKIITKKDIIEG